VERVSFALVLALVACGCNPTSLKSGYCHKDGDCPSKVCNMDTRMCVPVDAPVESPMDASVETAEVGDGGDVADAHDGGDARDASDARDAPLKCPEISCADGGYDGSPGVCELEAGVCVECLVDGDCTRKSTAPICEARACRACKADAECPGPAICMTDGHCAASTEVIYVEFNSNGCPGASGSATAPYCTPNMGVDHLMTGQNVLVIRGATADRLTLGTTGVNPVIVGKNGASIPATAATAIQVSSDVVLIRDLLVTGGTAAGSKGVVATGSLATLKLSNVQVSLGTGLGVQADSGALLVMDHCTVTSNNKGGIFVDGANFDLKNTTVTGNGPGDDMGAAWGGLRLKNLSTVVKKSLQLLTVMGNNQVGVSCSGSVDASGVLVSASSGGVDISPSCNFNSCGTAATATCGAQP
jgi:hypothetical protein